MKNLMKHVLSALLIMAVGFVLFNVAFLLAYLVIGGMEVLIGGNGSYRILSWLVYLALILIISWFILRAKLNVVVKSSYFTMPLMVVLVLTGVLLNQYSKWLIFGAASIVILGVLLFLYRKKLSWHYYFALGYDVVLALIVVLADIQI